MHLLNAYKVFGGNCLNKMLIRSFGFLPLCMLIRPTICSYLETFIYQALIKHPPTDKLVTWEELQLQQQQQLQLRLRLRLRLRPRRRLRLKLVVKVFDEGRHRATATSECVQQKVATKSEKNEKWVAKLN